VLGGGGIIVRDRKRDRNERKRQKQRDPGNGSYGSVRGKNRSAWSRPYISIARKKNSFVLEKGERSGSGEKNDISGCRKKMRDTFGGKI